MNRKCIVTCVEDSHDPIPLVDRQEIVLGRSQQTKIKNSRCSRQQVSFTANFSECSVVVKQLGDNPSALEGGLLLAKGEFRTLRHGDTIEFLEGLHKHRVCFEPPPNQRRNGDADDEAPKPKKAKIFEKNGGSSASGTGTWETIDQGNMLVYTPHNVTHSEKVAGYDLDWTLVGTKSGRVYPKDKDDWCILLPEIPGKLKKLHAEGYKLAIFSNQAGIGSKRVIISEFQQKIESVIRKLGVPMQAFISTNTSVFRKPLTGMWQHLAENKNNGLQVELSESLYCGDAAGRPQGWAPKKKKDFSCSDRLFAMNIGIRFFTPEEHFQGRSAAPFTLPNFQPLQLSLSSPLTDPANARLASSSPELVVMVGGPGSGKSHFARTHLSSYTYVNMDQLKSAPKCVQMVKTALARRESVVVDNTNPDKKSRARFVAEARAVNIRCRCFKMLTSKEQSRHNNRFRELTDPSHAIVSEIIIRQYEKIFEEPKAEEGFEEIVGINCIPNFKKEEHKKLYQQFLVA